MNQELEKKIDTILQAMLVTIDLPQYNNAMVVAQCCIDIINENKEVTLIDIERLLRRTKSRVRLVGLPLKLYGDQYTAQRPHDETFYEFGLWVEMNGPEELKNMFQRFKLSVNDVDVSLERTGFLFMNQPG